jgi:hypothetical protein
MGCHLLYSDFRFPPGYTLLSFWKKKESEGRPVPSSKTSWLFADLSDRSQAALRGKIGLEEHLLLPGMEKYNLHFKRRRDLMEHHVPSYALPLSGKLFWEARGPTLNVVNPSNGTATISFLR